MEKTGLDFGQLIAYLIPGFLSLYALSTRVGLIKALFGGDKGVPETGAILPLLLLALGAGVMINAIGWALVRPLIALSGVKRPRNLDYTKLTADDIKVYKSVVEDNFRYHQFYTNMLVATVLLSSLWLAKPVYEPKIRNISWLFVVCILFFAARDSLSRAYRRMLALQTKEHKDAND